MPGESVFVALQEIPLTSFIKGEMTNSCFSSVTFRCGKTSLNRFAPIRHHMIHRQFNADLLADGVVVVRGHQR